MFPTYPDLAGQRALVTGASSGIGRGIAEALLAQGARVRQFDVGELLLREGEPANQFYLIESGKIALEAHEPCNGSLLLQTLGAGDVLGWSWLFPPFTWHFQAKATEPANVIILDGAHLLSTSERDHEFGFELMKPLSPKLRATKKAVMAPVMKTSPCAKLIMNRTP